MTDRVPQQPPLMHAFLNAYQQTTHTHAQYVENLTASHLLFLRTAHTGTKILEHLRYLPGADTLPSASPGSLRPPVQPPAPHVPPSQPSEARKTGEDLPTNRFPVPETFSPSGSTTWKIQVGAKTHPQLIDHSIAGVVVVPAAMAIEWCSRAARAFAPQLYLQEITDLKILKGITLPGFHQDTATTLTISCRLLTPAPGDKNRGTPTSNAAVVLLEISGPQGNVHYRCRGQLATEARLPEIPSDLLPDTLPRLLAGHSLAPWPEKSIYGDSLFHGPAFQMLSIINGVSPTGIIATLAGVRAANWPQDLWVTDPVICDGSLQLALLWATEMLGSHSLPTAIGAAHTYYSPGTGPFRGVLYGRSTSRNKTVSDIFIFDMNGNLVADYLRVETHVRPNSPRPASP